MSETLDAYIARQAATVGRRAWKVTRTVWVPQLPGAQGACLGKLDAPHSPNLLPSLALSLDGHTLLTGHGNGVIRRWDLAHGTLVWSTQGGHSAGVVHVALSPDQTRLISASHDHSVRLWDVESGQELSRLDGHTNKVNVVCWAPDGQQLASGGRDGTIRLWDAASGQSLRVLEGYADWIYGLAWALDGLMLVSAGFDGTIRLWDTTNGAAHPPLKLHDRIVGYVSFSPDSRQLLVGSSNGLLFLVDVARRAVIHHWQLGRTWVSAHTWSPDGRFVAAIGRDQTSIHVWDAHTGIELAQFEGNELQAYQLVWAADNGFLAVSHYRVSDKRDVICLWDTHTLWPAAPLASAPAPASGPLPAILQSLPNALAQLLQLGYSPPLVLLHDLLALTGGCVIDGPLASLTSEPRLGALIALRWPAPARIGLVALLLHQLPLTYWLPPEGVLPTEVRDALTTALQGEAIPPEVPPPPLSLLREAARQVDDQLLALLTILGSDAVAADPGLPLRLLSRVEQLPTLNESQRHLLGVWVRFVERGGQACGRSPGADRALVGGVESGRLRTDWGSLLPSQLALDKQLLAYRYARGELLFRACEVAEPPQLRPTVLLLDTSPPTFGPIEALTRLAAFVVGRTLLAAGVPVVLLTPSDMSEQVLSLERPANLVEIWIARTLAPLEVVRALRLASAVRANLRDEGGLEPAILLLTQPWCGAEAAVPAVAELRGLFVQYPGQQAHPALAGHCARWQSLAPGETSRLTSVLGHLLG
jgi:hypothetical protein